MKKCLSILFVLCITLCFMLTGCASSSTLNLEEYVVIETIGANGYGSINKHYLDSEAIAKKYASRLNKKYLSDDGLSFVLPTEDGGTFTYEFDGVATTEEAIVRLFNSYLPNISLENNTQNLSNGDKIGVCFSSSFEQDVKNLETLFDIKINYGDFEYTIKGLQELKKVDPFVNVDFNLTGENGKASCRENAYSYIYLDNETITAKLTADAGEKNGSLSNGDMVHMQWDSIDYTAEVLATKYGIELSRTEADLQIYGLNETNNPNADKGKKATINLNDYVVYKFSNNYENGVDTTLSVSLDYRRIIFDYRESLNKYSGGYASTTIDSAVHAYMCNLDPFTIVYASSTSEKGSGHPKIESAEGFKNGQELKFTWKVNEEYISRLKELINADFTYSDFTYKVEGLKKLIEVDVFEDCVVEYQGANGSASVSVNIRFPDTSSTGTLEIGSNIVSENNGSLSNGDTVIASVNRFYLQTAYGINPTRTEIEITVSGLQ